MRTASCDLVRDVIRDVEGVVQRVLRLEIDIQLSELLVVVAAQEIGLPLTITSAPPPHTHTETCTLAHAHAPASLLLTCLSNLNAIDV